MTELAPLDLTDYVRSSAQLLELPLTDAQVERVAAHLQRTRVIAAMLRDVPLSASDELAQIFCPAPFPDEDPRP
jgi:hypothetical protein